MNKPTPITIHELCELFNVDINELPDMGQNGPMEVLEKRLDKFKLIFKKAYRKIAMECHPDKNPPPEKVEYFKKITSIYKDMSKLKVVPLPKPRPMQFQRVYVRTNFADTSSTTTGGTNTWYWTGG